MRICSIDGCEKKHYAKEYCSFHYKRSLKGKNLYDPKNSELFLKVCTIADCDGEHVAKGYCAKHYAQWKHHGKIFTRTIFTPNAFQIIGALCYITIHDKYGNEKTKTVIDAEDYEKCKNYKWHLDGNGYVVFKSRSRTIYLSKYVFGHNIKLDHKNRKRLDNRKTNLRPCTRTQNSFNSGLRSDNTSGYRGVSWNKIKHMWRVRIYAYKKCKYDDYFMDKIEAVKAYNRVAIKYHGEFATLNPI